MICGRPGWCEGDSSRSRQGHERSTRVQSLQLEKMESEAFKIFHSISLTVLSVELFRSVDMAANLTSLTAEAAARVQGHTQLVAESRCA